jgi:hypothetical protein
VRAWPAIVAIVAAAGCGGSQAQPQPPAVPLLPQSAAPAVVVGGTPSMRERARTVLAGMGPWAISQVRFGPPPAGFGLRAAQGVFENAFTGSAPRGEPRVRGWTEAVQGAPMTGTGSGTFDRPLYDGPPPTEAEVRAAVGEGARRAGFDVVSLRVMHPARAAASVVVRAKTPDGFDRRYAAFDDAVSGIEGRMDGLAWEVDPCGRPVVVRSAVSWADPSWLCPDPTILGFGESAADCRKEPKPDLSC